MRSCRCASRHALTLDVHLPLRTKAKIAGESEWIATIDSHRSAYVGNFAILPLRLWA